MNKRQLGQLVAGFVLNSFAVSIPDWRSTRAESTALLCVIRNVFGSDKSCLSVGKMYLDAYPDEARPGVLEDLLIDHSQGVESWIGSITDNQSGSNTANIVKRHENDCSALNIVKLNGCIFSRTEARLYAAAAIREDEFPIF